MLTLKDKLQKRFLPALALGGADCGGDTNQATEKSIEWPAGIGAKGNEGIAAQVQQTQGAVG